MQLFKKNTNIIAPWNTGYSTFLISHNLNNHRIPVAVECRIDALDYKEYAFLDTGAEWTVIGGDIAKLLINEIDLSTDIETTMSTRLGKIDGWLNWINISLLAAPDSGNDLTFESRVFVSEEWAGPPIVLGYQGFLQHIRFALDPGIKMGEQFFYFGLVD